MIVEFLKWYFHHHVVMVLGIGLMGAMGAITMVVSQSIVDAFSLSENAGLLVHLGSFFLLLIACGWTYDKYKEWQLLQKKD
ncbi:MAG: hypothetical protein MPJ78_05825 [Hyphomicrobiaceae bacterium]|nr:hypothetical protein [Hyphomicrobiaceae bacterium]